MEIVWFSIWNSELKWWSFDFQGRFLIEMVNVWFSIRFLNLNGDCLIFNLNFWIEMVTVGFSISISELKIATALFSIQKQNWNSYCLIVWYKVFFNHPGFAGVSKILGEYKCSSHTHPPSSFAIHTFWRSPPKLPHTPSPVKPLPIVIVGISSCALLQASKQLLAQKLSWTNLH